MQSSFAVVPESATIRSRMARMWLVSVVGKGGAQLVQLVSLVALARLLSPSDFGLIAMVMAVIGVANIFRDLGLSAATVRAKDISSEQASTLMYVNIGFGAVMTTIVLGCAPFVAQFYGDERLTPIAHALAWTFLLGSMGTQHLSLLRRQMKFAALAWMNLIAVTLGQGVAVFLAFQEFGYWSLVIGTVLTQASKVLMAWTVNSWRPEKPVFDANVKRMVSFGGNLMIFSLLGYIAFNVHNVVIGWRFGPEEVGYYNRAFAIVSLLAGYVVGPLSLVAPAALARMTDEPDRYNETYLNTVAMMLLLTAPISFVTAIAAKDIVGLLLGSRWEDSVVIVQILALGVIPQTLCATSGWLYLSHGDSRSMMQWGVGGWGALIVFLIVGASYGTQGVAVAYASGMFILLYPCMLMAFRRTSLRFSDLAKRALPIVAPAMISAGPMLWFYVAAPDWGAPLRLGVAFLGYGAVYLLLLLVFRQGALLADVGRQMLQRKAVA